MDDGEFYEYECALVLKLSYSKVVLSRVLEVLAALDRAGTKSKIIIASAF